MKTAADQYDDLITQAGTEWDVDPQLIKAVMLAESKGDPRAVSSAGAIGLMQMKKDTAKGLGVTDLSDPTQQIFAGAKYLSEALDAEKGDVARALLYYHGGPNWRGAYGLESRNYPDRVAGFYQKLGGADDQGGTTQTADASGTTGAPAPSPLTPPSGKQIPGSVYGLVMPR